jgi:RimJ/RimL family protein N-acetyltransferase
VTGEQLSVRTATDDDVEAFTAVVSAVADEERWIATEPPVDREAFARRIRDALAKGEALFVLEAGGTVVGTLGLHTTHARGVVTLGMCIVADVRGQGGGRALLDAAMAWLDASEMHKVELEVWPDNERAIALYTRYGFELEGLRRDHYRRRDGSLRSSLIMARPVSRERGT